MKALMIIMVTYYHSVSVSTQQFESVEICDSMKTSVTNTISPRRDENFWTSMPQPRVELTCLEIKQ